MHIVESVAEGLGTTDGCSGRSTRPSDGHGLPMGFA